jgi:prepilin-type N-terminal cleavage/methylation domain-containing protein
LVAGEVPAPLNWKDEAGGLIAKMAAQEQMASNRCRDDEGRTMTTSKKKRMKNDGGFTLIELLIVIGLLAALTALILPQFADRSEEAKAAATEYNAVGLDRTLRQFNAINGVWPTFWNTGTDATVTEGTNSYAMMSTDLRDALATAGALATDTFALQASHTLTADYSTNLTAAGMHLFVQGPPTGFRSANDVAGAMGALASPFVFPETAQAILLAAGTDLQKDGVALTFQGRPLSEICSAASGYRALLLPITEDIYWTMKADGSTANMGSPSAMSRAMAWGGGSDVKLESVPKVEGNYVWAVFRTRATSPMSGAGSPEALHYLVGLIDGELNTY